MSASRDPRPARGGLRNVEAHAEASRVQVRVTHEGAMVVLEIADDGKGLDPREEARARDEGHVGVSIPREPVHDAGGRLDLEPGAAGGTVMRVEVPVP